MLHFLVDKYDAIGCNYSLNPFKHFSGNFWWATSNYIKKLDFLPDNCKRHKSEWWILSNETVNSYVIHNSLIDHYNNLYPKDKYIN